MGAFYKPYMILVYILYTPCTFIINLLLAAYTSLHGITRLFCFLSLGLAVALPSFRVFGHRPSVGWVPPLSFSPQGPGSPPLPFLPWATTRPDARRLRKLSPSSNGSPTRLPPPRLPRRLPPMLMPACRRSSCFWRRNEPRLSPWKPRLSRLTPSPVVLLCYTSRGRQRGSHRHHPPHSSMWCPEYLYHCLDHSGSLFYRPCSLARSGPAYPEALCPR